MTTRTTSRPVTFKRPFALSGLDGLQSAGTYTIETLEEEMDAVSRFAWKRISTVIQLCTLGAIENHEIDPGELEKALARDVAGGKPLSMQPVTPAKATDEPTPNVRRKRF